MSVTDNPQGRPIEVAAPTGRVDRAKDDHAICIVRVFGEILERFTVAHDAAGLRTMTHRLLAAGVIKIGIERPDGPVVDALRQAGPTVSVIPPGQLKNLRSRYGSAGNKDDRFDAYVLAEVVHTDARRLRPLEVDTEPTTALRQAVRARKDLVEHRVGVANQLRAHLQIAFPGAVGLFRDNDSAISLRFLERFPTADSLAYLAGAAPSTRQTGKTKTVSFRWAADKQLHDALCDFAGDSRPANPWAAELYARARARGHDHPHAVRILARAWVNIIWPCWTDERPYDPTSHRALQRHLNQDQQTVAA